MEERLKSSPGLSENALRNLSVVLESAQRVSRLALGAATENLHSDPYAQMTDQEMAAELGGSALNRAVQ